MGKVTKLEQLEDFAFNQDVTVLNDVSTSDHKGSTMFANGQAVIFLNSASIANDAEKTCTLAEEIGHVQTGTSLECEAYLQPEYARWLKRRNLILATRWAIQRLLPYEQIQDALDEGNDEFEIAEELNVSVEFLRLAFEYYEGQGIKFRVQDSSA